MTRYLVDGMNVIGSRPNGWWRDRDRAVVALADALARLAGRGEDEIAAVFDGRLPAGLEEGLRSGVEIRAAGGGGRDRADDRIVALVAGDLDPPSLVVVTADRELKRRVLALGAEIEGPRTFLARLDRAGSPEPAGR